MPNFHEAKVASATPKIVAADTIVAVEIVFASLGAFGHLYPMMPLALAFAEAGHEVTIATGKPFLDRLPLPTVPGYPRDLDLDWAINETKRRQPDIAGGDLSIAMFADVTAEQVAPVMSDVISKLTPDLVIFEGMDVGAGIAANLAGVPAAAYAIGLVRMAYVLVHPAAVGYHRNLWLRRDLEPPPGNTLLADALIDPAPATLRPYGGQSPVPSIPIRAVAYSESAAEVPDWLRAPRTRPRVYLTLGTVSFGAVDVLNRAVNDLATLDVDVLVSVGPEGDPAALGQVPANVRVERFVAQSAVLPLVDLIVHHGGTGTVLAALELGLPQLILPQGADQFFNAEILTDVGAGRALLNDAQAPGAIGEAAVGLLSDGRERAVAAQLRDEIAGMPAPADVIPALVALVR